jgi:hypothetical protein
MYPQKQIVWNKLVMVRPAERIRLFEWKQNIS